MVSPASCGGSDGSGAGAGSGRSSRRGRDASHLLNFQPTPHRQEEAELPCAATVLATATPPDSATPVRKVAVQNLEKQRGLATKLVRELAPDVLLAQEISLDTEEDALFPAHHVSPSGYGTAVYGRGDVLTSFGNPLQFGRIEGRGVH